jgi:RND family efflux transporter MFP subunit
VLPLVLVLCLAACSKPAPPEAPIRAVKVMTVGVQPMQSGVEFAGEVRARVESRLSFRVGGKLTTRPVEVGQRVKAGQLLAQLDPQDFRLADAAARAQRSAASTQRDLAAADYQRYKALKDQNFISGAELERRESALKGADAQLAQATAQASSQGNQTGYTRLLADVAGVITAVDAEPGQVLAAGAPVLRLAQDGPRDVVFAVPEDKVAAMRPGSAVSVRPWQASSTLAGVVREVAASADPVTRTYAVKVALPAGSALALGSTVSVLPQALSRSGTPVIKLPTSALLQSGQSTVVWVVDAASMTVRQQPVQVLTADGNEVVIAGGLLPGAQVVTAGVHVLSPGQQVSIYKPNGSLAPVNAARAATESEANAPSVAPASAAATPAK